MLRNLIVSVALPLFLLCACGTGKQETTVTVTDPDQPLAVAISRDMPGHFIVGGERYGYSYELLLAYSEDRQRDISLQTGLSRNALFENLKNGETDIMVTLSAGAEGAGLSSVPLYSTTYVVLANKKNASLYKNFRGSVSDMMGGRIVMVSSGFESTKSYDMMLDSLSSALLYVTPRDVFDLARSLSSDQFDLMICEKSEALLAAGLYQNVVSTYEFEEEVPVSLVFTAENEALKDDFSRWIESFRATRDYAAVTRVYLEKGFVSQFPTINKPNRVIGGISVWDNLIREVGEKEAVDWRLLSAIAYNESRFRTDVESHRGAKGMMQIMPVVARQFNMEESDLHDPRTSLTVAARLLKTIENMMGFDESVSDSDRLSIVLAAYNCGVGNVTNARRLAITHGEDKNSWEAVSKYLVLMGDKDFVSDTVNYRTFRGSGETLAFVDNVLDKYTAYRSAVD